MENRTIFCIILGIAGFLLDYDETALYQITEL